VDGPGGRDELLADPLSPVGIRGARQLTPARAVSGAAKQPLTAGP
jgi:hypothetical protein